MKTNFFWSLVIVILISSCSRIETIAETPSDDVQFGTIEFNLSEKEVFEVISSKKRPNIEEVLENVMVHIFENTSGNTVFLSKYSDLPRPIELTVNSYTAIFYPSISALERFDTPGYGTDIGFTEFEVSEGIEESVDVILSLWDAAFSIDFEDDIIERFPNVKVKIFSSTASLEWSANDDLRKGFFPLNKYIPENRELIAGADIFTLQVSATAIDGSDIVVEKEYSPVLANKHFKIRILTSPTSTAGFEITLGEEEIIEDEIVFPN